MLRYARVARQGTAVDNAMVRTWPDALCVCAFVVSVIVAGITLQIVRWRQDRKQEGDKR